MNLTETSAPPDGGSPLKQLCIGYIKAKRSLIAEERLLTHSHNPPHRPEKMEDALSEQEVLEMFEHPEKFQGPEIRIQKLYEELRQLSVQLMPYFRAIRNRSFYIEYEKDYYQFFVNEEGEIIFYIAPHPAMDAEESK